MSTDLQLPLPVLHAFIDESGDRGSSPASSEHFVMSAALVTDEGLARASAWLADLREDLNRPPGTVLHWVKIRSHSGRLHAARSLGEQPWLRVVSVVVCKRHLQQSYLTEEQAYLYTFRLLLERLSWASRNPLAGQMSYTLAHITRFRMQLLRDYEARLRSRPTQIAWAHLDPKGGSIDQPARVEMLQLADLVASATAAAFEPDAHGNTERRYLQELAPRLYRQGDGPGRLTSYGLKMHPWSETTKAAYPWVAAL